MRIIITDKKDQKPEFEPLGDYDVCSLNPNIPIDLADKIVDGLNNTGDILYGDNTREFKLVSNDHVLQQIFDKT